MLLNHVPTVPRHDEKEHVPLTILFLGTCQVAALSNNAHFTWNKAEHHLLESFSHSPIPDIGLENYDGVVISLTLRHILSEATGKSLVNSDMIFARLTTREQSEVLISRCAELISTKIARLAEKYSGKPTFLTSFFCPSRNYLGNLLTRQADLGPNWIIGRLNAILCEAVSAYKNCYYFEVNDVLNAVGRMHLQDDVINTASHGSYIADNRGMDKDRIVPAGNVLDIYDAGNASRLYAIAFWRVLADNFSILRVERPIKLIICDLDDTLWRGVAADDALPSWLRVEGWPAGLVEALLFFRTRGGLLAICSKNDRVSTLDRLRSIWQGALVEEDFVSIKINWEPKSKNIAEILNEGNLLPQNVLFLEDNPREMDEVASAFPDIRRLGFDHYHWRRQILFAPEFQVPVLTQESRARTELTRATIERATLAKGLSREEWLKSLELEAKCILLRNPCQPEGVRAFELLNKTNQFNTTGKRWANEEFSAFFGDGGIAVLLSLRDKTADNGIVGVAMVRKGAIEQAVLSCRVFGLGAENVMGSVATRIAIEQAGQASGRVIDTGKNLTCHKFFEGIGFNLRGDEYISENPCTTPDWIALK